MFLKGKRVVLGKQSLGLTVLKSVTSASCVGGMEELLLSSVRWRRESDFVFCFFYRKQML